MSQKEIGGYFGLELNRGKEYYPDAIKLNSGRNCLKYIILAQKPSKIFMPYYIDKSMKEQSILKMGTKLEYYHIDRNLELEREIQVHSGEKILVNNYFSLKNDYIISLAKVYGSKLIVDNTQSFFCRNIPNIDTLYSLGSKYFGVPNGGYLFTQFKIETEFEQDFSFDKMNHLLGRLDVSAERFYDAFKESKIYRNNQDVKKMSKITQYILASIDYERVRLIRERNFFYLHSFLKTINELSFDDTSIVGPMNYPFLFKHENLRKTLINNKIYIPTYWQEIIDDNETSAWEKYLSKYLLPLPIDQRYDIDDMNKILEVIRKGINK